MLGKASLTEFCGSRAEGIVAGYSAANGQTQSPYIRGGRRPDDGIAGHTSAGGSSSGSGAGVAAGFAPVSVATETAGSLVLPANRAALYGLRMTQSSVSTDGVYTLARGWDTLGAMAKGAQDVADLVAVLVREEVREQMVGDGFNKEMGMGMKGLRLGCVDFEKWKPLDGRASSEEEMAQMVSGR